MRRVAITGIGCLSAAGVGVEPLLAALSREATALPTDIEVVRGRHRKMSLARLPPFDREAYLPSRKLRRMGDLSQIWMICCLMARSDAFRGGPEAPLPPPERRGAFLGTGFGCIDTTWEYLTGMFREGAALANPFLFAESVANAPAGHSAIELDTRGANITLTVGDASAATALVRGARSIRDGRLDLAYCGGIEMMCDPLVKALANLRSPEFLGEGCTCLILEALDRARARKARIYAEVTGAALASDPEAPETGWSRDPDAILRTMERALSPRDREDRPPEKRVRKIFLHAPGQPQADAAEISAVRRLLPAVPAVAVSRTTGTFAAAGGFSLVAATLDAGDSSAGSSAGNELLVNASSWGGCLVSVIFRAGGGENP